MDYYSDEAEYSEEEEEEEEEEVIHSGSAAFRMTITPPPQQPKKKSKPSTSIAVKARPAPKKAVKPSAAAAVVEDDGGDDDGAANKKKRNPPAIKPWDKARVKGLLGHVHLVEDPAKLTEQTVQEHEAELQTLTQDMFFIIQPASSTARMFGYSPTLQRLASFREKDAFPFSVLKPKTACDDMTDPGRLFEAIESRAIKTQQPGLLDHITKCVLHDPRTEQSFALSTTDDVKRLLGTVFMFKMRTVNEKNYDASLQRVNTIRETLADWFCRDLTPPATSLVATAATPVKTNRPKKAVEPVVEKEKEKKKGSSKAKEVDDKKKKKSEKRERHEAKKRERSGEEQQPPKKKQRELTTEELVTRCGGNNLLEEYEANKAWFYETYGAV